MTFATIRYTSYTCYTSVEFIFNRATLC